MAAPDVNALFSRAETAYAAGRNDAARADLAIVLRSIGEHPAVLHLLALVEAAAGRVPEAGAAFVRALSVAPNDPQINNNFANLLDSAGQFAPALRHYDHALAQSPGFTAARLNRATTRQKAGDLTGALSDLDAVLRVEPANTRALEARGAVRRLRGERDEAAADFGRAVELAPDRTLALHGAARLASERNDDSAVELYRRAYAAAPGDREIVLGYAEALEAAGEDGGIDLLVAATAAEPGWIAGHDSLARMRSEAGEDFAHGYAAAVASRPGDRALALAYWRCLARGSRHEQALAALDASGLPPDRELRLFEAVLASEAGDAQRANLAFAALGDDAEANLARGRHALRQGDPARAAALLEPVARSDSGLVTAWAHLGLAWRLTGDDRAAWLNDQPGLHGTQDLPVSAAELGRLADVLRGLHRTRAHPIGQSLRGGTQTRGRLFDRAEPEIGSLREMLLGAVAAHTAGLPPRDDTHPLLRYRDRPFGFDGSWSVRLNGGGFHINHIHPEGVLSSACYIALPDVTGGDRPGWLEVGAPPVELGLDLAPLATIEPRPGRLALFPSYMFHGTRPFPAGERLTVAFDTIA